MNTIKTSVAYVIVLVAILSTIFCPFLNVFVVGNWNLYEVDTNLFFINNGLLVLVLLSLLIKKGILQRVFSWIYFIWTLLSIAAVYFKVNNYFGMSLGDKLIAKAIDFKWGWMVLITSALILILLSPKRKTLDKQNEK